jgi:Plasma-membrane choline transporter
MGIVRIIRYLISNAKKQRESRQNDNCDGGELLICMLDCLIKLFEEVLDYFNHWSYVFCGIYGYSYLQSGKMVVELFRARGWETIVQDDLIGYVLAFTTFTVGVFTGLGCMCLERVVDAMVEPDPVDANKDPNDLEPWDYNQSFLFGPLPHPQFQALG